MIFLLKISVLDLTCPTIGNLQSSTVVWNRPIPVGFPDDNNVNFIYSGSNGNALSPPPTELPGGQYQFTFPPGTIETITATAVDGLGNEASCQFTVATPPGK